jgi:1,4-dihydroxy-2-naphthoyl-CoA hydrolase
MGFTVIHTVRFQETDAAGVVYFANGLTICHGAYEASLQAVGFNLTVFFGPGNLAYPVVHATIDFRRPMRCGDQVQINLQPEQLDECSFEVQYRLSLELNPDQSLAQALTRHVCIETGTRQRHPLPPEMETWLQRWAD